MPNVEEIPPSLDAVIGQNLSRIREGQGLTQDQLARRCRQAGLEWSQPTVLLAERGQKTLDFAEVTALMAVLGVPVVELLRWHGKVKVGSAEISHATLLRLFGEGRGPKVGAALFNVDAAVSSSQRFRRRQSRYEKLAPGITSRPDLLQRAELAERDDATRKAARKLRVDALDLSVAAFGLWGRSLTDERDARVRASTFPDTPPPPPRSLQALRGRVTRELLDDLQTRLKGG